jgi:hypothetical protein
MLILNNFTRTMGIAKSAVNVSSVCTNKQLFHCSKYEEFQVIKPAILLHRIVVITIREAYY